VLPVSTDEAVGREENLIKAAAGMCGNVRDVRVGIRPPIGVMRQGVDELVVCVQSLQPYND
jgi:hypothetical protein